MSTTRKQGFTAKVLNYKGAVVSKGIDIILIERSSQSMTSVKAQNGLFKQLEMKPGIYDVCVNIPNQPPIYETVRIARGQTIERNYVASTVNVKKPISCVQPFDIEKEKAIPATLRKSLQKRGIRYLENILWIAKSGIEPKEQAKLLGVTTKELQTIIRSAQKDLPKGVQEQIEKIAKTPVCFGELSKDVLRKITGKSNSEIIRRRDILRADDLHTLAEKTNAQLATETSKDLIDYMSPVKDQNPRGTCTSFAASSLREYFENISRGRGHQVDISEEHNYWISRRDSNIGGDGHGTSLAANNFVEEGGCNEIDWPYNRTFVFANITHKPANYQAVSQVWQYKIDQLVELPSKDVQAMKDCISAGRVATVGTSVFWANWDGSTGIISMPLEGAVSNGNHGVCLVGWYNDDNAPGGGYFIMKNSWGLGHSPNSPMGPRYRGYYLMPFEYYEKWTFDPCTFRDSLYNAAFQWIAEYYTNSKLDGIPNLTNTIHSNENTLLSSVPSGFNPVGQFSALFSKTVRMTGGLKVFTIEVEGGVRMWVDDRLLINDWRQASLRTVSASLPLTPGDHVFRIEYFKENGPVKLVFDTMQEVWPVQLYASSDLSGPEHIRFADKKEPNLEWHHVPPLDIDTWNFSGRCRNRVHFDEDAAIRFRAVGTGGMRVLVDGAVVLDTWTNGEGEKISNPINIVAGDHVIFLEFRNDTTEGRAAFRLEWFEDVWRSEFYNNKYLADMPVLKRTDNSLDFNWGTNSPDPMVNANNFSARFTRALNVDKGFYTFSVLSDDGIRVTVDGRRIIDTWYYNTVTQHSEDVFLTQGVHDVCVEFYEGGANARCRLRWQPTVWTGEYFNNAELSGSPTIQNDNDLHFNWAIDGMQVPGIPADQFAVRWKRTIYLSPGRYRCLIRANGGVRMFADDCVIMNRWGEQGVDTPSVSEFDTIGGNVRLRIEFADLAGNPSFGFDMVQSSWLGEYYSNSTCSGSPSLYRFDPDINFDWSVCPPTSNLRRDDFSVRWTRAIELPCGRYQIFARCNDGIRIYMDGRLILDRWEDNPMLKVTHANIDIVGRIHNMVIEYYDKSQASLCHVWFNRGI